MSLTSQEAEDKCQIIASWTPEFKSQLGHQLVIGQGISLWPQLPHL